jgi:hypothetical protein
MKKPCLIPNGESGEVMVKLVGAMVLPMIKVKKMEMMLLLAMLVTMATMTLMTMPKPIMAKLPKKVV